MKTWWQTAAAREKQAVLLAGIVIVIFMLYEIIFAPLQSAVTTARLKVHSNQNLLAWMQTSNQRIQTLEQSQLPAAAPSSASLLSSLQNDINNQSFAKSVVELQQADNDAIQLRLQKVGFDTLMKWLIAISQQQSLLVTQMSISPKDAAGVVDAEMKLQASST